MTTTSEGRRSTTTTAQAAAEPATKTRKAPVRRKGAALVNGQLDDAIASLKSTGRALFNQDKGDRIAELSAIVATVTAFKASLNA